MDTVARSPSADSGPRPSSGFSSIHSTPSYAIEPITTEEGLSKLQDDWNRLSETAEEPNVFMTFDWFRAWNERFTQEESSGRRPHVLVLKKDGIIRGISPLIRREVSRFGLGGRKLEFVGQQADYNDLVLGDDPVGQNEAIVEYLAQTQDQWDLVNLRDLRETGNAVAGIEKSLSHAGLTYRVVAEEERCPYLPIDAPPSVIVSRLSRSSGHTIRNQQRRIERMSTDGLRTRIIENPHEERGLLQKLIALESQKHVHGELSQPFIAKYPEVFQPLLDTLGPRGWVYIALMELDDRPVAWQLGFRCGKKLWDYSTAYDHTFSRLSPGTMLVNAVLDYGFSHGYNELDFLRGEESYKARWSTGVHQSYWLRIWSRNWISRAHALFYLDLKPAVRRLLGRSN
jgi:CelD/BcsL family acetyltransferase involved in cellulose biosynthesis